MTTEDITVSLNVTGENPTSQIFKGIQHLPGRGGGGNLGVGSMPLTFYQENKVCCAILFSNSYIIIPGRTLHEVLDRHHALVVIIIGN